MSNSIKKEFISLKNEDIEDKTIIVISHRFNQQKLFDKILKLEKGRVCEVSKL